MCVCVCVCVARARGGVCVCVCVCVCTGGAFRVCARTCHDVVCVGEQTAVAVTKVQACASAAKIRCGKMKVRQN